MSVCNRLLLESRELAKRCAALDERWEDGWDVLRCELDRLEELLRQPEAASILRGRATAYLGFCLDSYHHSPS